MIEEVSIPPTQRALNEVLLAAKLADVKELERLWRAVEMRRAAGQPSDRLQQRFQKLYALSSESVRNRQTSVPVVAFPPALPVSERREEIAELIDGHQVLILAGETGSGKTTQLPKICLSLGRGIRGQIGHTQPRRIAATTVAGRIAEELQCELGTAVGYQVRFSDQSDSNTLIKLMTDGILLAEIHNDPLLYRYDTIIVDEAHERSLNIDFLLGYLKQILPKRPDLKLIITSATIDVERFAKHFDNAPVLEVSGRTYPVEVLYRPWAGEQEDQAHAIMAAVEEILTMPHRSNGDILVFLSGEREIRETAHTLRKAQFPHLAVLPLYARLSMAEQRRVFQPHTGRRVVLATNVAETSITVPGIGYVIDPGYARVSRYSVRTKVQRLPIEPISQASANQRAGRCGRVSSGVCIRLYEREDFEQRPEFTDPEIQRTNLAAVVLQMLHLGIGDIRKFPFVDPPDPRFVRDGFKLLEELQAVTAQEELTPLGRQLAALPLDPRLARMIIEGARLNCLREVLIICAALTIQDPRERPADKQQAADEKHRRFWDENSDFLAYLNLWHYTEEQRQELSQNQWRRQCSKEFLSFLRLREWRELHHQMRLAVKTLKLPENKELANYDAVHKALLSGLLSNLGNRIEESGEREYLGARQRKFSIFPGSSQFKRRPKWVVVAEMLETSKLFGHCAARIEPEWVLGAAEHMLKHHYYQPHYSAKTGQVRGYDRITLFGLILADKKPVNYSDIDPSLAREIFVRQALVEGGYRKSGKRGGGQFFKHNQQQIEAVQTLEAKSRRRDILVDDEALYQFYDERVPAEVVNLGSFERWRKKAEQDNPTILHIPRSVLMQHAAGDITEAQFPDQLQLDNMVLPLTYHFEPGHPDDGVSLGVPAGVLHAVPEHRLDWLVPGLLRDKCIFLIRSLAKQWRKQFVPVPHTVDQIMPRLYPSNKPLVSELHTQLQHFLGTRLPDDMWQGVDVEAFYRMNIQVLDDKGKLLDRGRDLLQLRERYKSHVQEGLQNAAHGVEREGLTQWDFGTLEESCRLEQNGIEVRAFPALVKEKEGVALRVLDNPSDAYAASVKGVVSLLAQRFSSTVKYLQKSLLKNRDMALSVVNIGNRSVVVGDIIHAAIYQVCLDGRPLPRNADEFEALAAHGDQLTGQAQAYENILFEVLQAMVLIRKQMKSHTSALALAFTFADIKEQLQNLVYTGFLFETPKVWLEQMPRYMQAITVRLEKAPLNVQKDKQAIAVLSKHWSNHTQRLAHEGQTAFFQNEHWLSYRWMIEELRVSLFAQNLKTRMPVSDKRLQKLWQESLG